VIAIGAYPHDIPALLFGDFKNAEASCTCRRTADINTFVAFYKRKLFSPRRVDESLWRNPGIIDKYVNLRINCLSACAVTSLETMQQPDVHPIDETNLVCGCLHNSNRPNEMRAFMCFKIREVIFGPFTSTSTLAKLTLGKSGATRIIGT